MKDLIFAMKKTLIDRSEDIAAGLDAGLLAITDSKVLEKFPIISIGVKTFNFISTYHQHVYTRNCLSLVQALKSGDQKRTEKLWDKLTTDPDKIQDFVDTLLLIVVDSSKPIKAAVVGHLIVALSKDQITYLEYDALVHLVHDASITALAALPTFFEGNEGKCYLSGIRRVAEEPLLLSLGVASRFGNSFRVSDLGKLLYRHGFCGTITE
jgi:regulator of sigma D